MPEHRGWMERLFELLLYAYPREFRRRFGDELRAALRSSVRIHGARPWAGPALLHVVWDTLASASRLRWAAVRAGDSESDSEGMMMGWGRSIRFAVRGLRKRPGFTAIAVATMALGIAANSTIFSMVHSVLLQPMPYEQPEELVFVWSDFSSIGIPRAWTSGPQVIRMREEADLFEDFAALQGASLAVTGPSGTDPEQVYVNVVSHNLFDVLGAAPERGRTFRPEEEGAGSVRTAILSHDMWSRSFGADPAVLGGDIFINEVPFTVVGIMPEGFEFRMHTSLGDASAPELWIPFNLDLAETGTDNHMFATLGRMKDGVTLEQASEQLRVVGQGYAADHYRTSDFRLYPVALHNDLVKDVRPALLMLMGGVGMLLLIVASNMATLFLGRASERERDIAVRTAIGADRASIMSLMISETLVVAVVGGALGLVLSAWTLDLFVGLVPDGIPRSEEISIGWGVAGFTAMVTLMAGLVAGLVPALRLSKPNLSETLKESAARGGGGQRARTVQRWLVVGQVAVSVVLLAGAGLIGRSLFALFRVDPGFDANGVTTMVVRLPDARYGTPEDRADFQAQLRARAEAIPGIDAVGISTGIPLTNSASQRRMEFGAAEVPMTLEEGESLDWWRSSEGYVEAMGLRVVEGRSFRPEDEGQPVVMIDETVARTRWPTTSPIGAYINRASDGTGGYRIIGVVSHGRMYNVYEDDRGQVLFHTSSRPTGTFVLVVRSEREAETLYTDLRATVAGIDPTLPIEFGTMDDVLSDSLARWRFSLILMGLFAGSALFLAGLGIYGVVSYSVTCRTRELGVRMALGAARTQVSRMVVGQGVRLVAFGLVLGLVASLGLGRVMGALLYDVSPTDPATLAAVAAVLVAVAWGSAAVPARRATRIPPTEAFRAE